MANTVVYNKHDYVTSLRKRLNRPVNWMDVMNVQISDVRTIVTGALTVEPVVVTGTRGTAMTHQDFTIAATTLTINNFRNIPIFIDEADRFQQSYFGSPEIAAFQARQISEYLEAQMLAQHASWVDFGQGDLDNTINDDTATITVSATNIDNLIRAIKRKIHVNNGIEFALEHGYFTIWRPTDWEVLEEFAMASGFTEADRALKSGIPVQKGFHYMGVDHYLSTQHTANHLFAGVKKVGKDLGILRGTYGMVKFIENPSDGNGPLFGLGIHGRVDYGWAFPSDATPTLQRVQEMGIDVNVA